MTPLFTYAPEKNADLLIAQMYGEMLRAGDLALIFAQPDFTLSTLFEVSKPPEHELIFAVDERGIWLATWFDRFASGAWHTQWIREDRRVSLAATTVSLRIYRAGLAAYKHLLIITWRPELLDLHKALGYTLIGCVPKLFHGRDCYFEAASFDSETTRRWRKQQEPAASQEALDQPPQEPALLEPERVSAASVLEPVAQALL